jgi:hypothetical protein
MGDSVWNEEPARLESYSSVIAEGTVAIETDLPH